MLHFQRVASDFRLACVGFRKGLRHYLWCSWVYKWSASYFHYPAGRRERSVKRGHKMAAKNANNFPIILFVLLRFFNHKKNQCECQCSWLTERIVTPSVSENIRQSRIRKSCLWITENTSIFLSFFHLCYYLGFFQITANELEPFINQISLPIWCWCVFDHHLLSLVKMSGLRRISLKLKAWKIYLVDIFMTGQFLQCVSSNSFRRLLSVLWSL